MPALNEQDGSWVAAVSTVSRMTGAQYFLSDLDDSCAGLINGEFHSFQSVLISGDSHDKFQIQGC